MLVTGPPLPPPPPEEDGVVVAVAVVVVADEGEDPRSIELKKSIMSLRKLTILFTRSSPAL